MFTATPNLRPFEIAHLALHSDKLKRGTIVTNRVGTFRVERASDGPCGVILRKLTRGKFARFDSLSPSAAVQFLFNLSEGFKVH